MMDKIIIGVDPATGELLWSHPHDTIGDMTATTPVWSDGNLLFVSSAYNGGMVPVAKSGPANTRFASWPSSRLRLVA